MSQIFPITLTHDVGYVIITIFLSLNLVSNVALRILKHHYYCQPVPILSNNIQKIALSFSSDSITKLTLCNSFTKGQSFEAIFRKKIAHISGLNLMNKVFVEGFALLIIAAAKATICPRLIFMAYHVSNGELEWKHLKLTCWQTGPIPRLSLLVVQTL